MPPEAALLESRALRDSVRSRTDALDRVKALILLPDDIHVTTSMVADYFEVGLEAVKSLVKDHREELNTSGYHVLAGQELRVFKNLSGIHPRTPWIALFPRRAVLNVAMLLRESPVARQVRMRLLDIEAERSESAPPYRPVLPPRGNSGPGPHWDEYEYLQAHPRATTPEQYRPAEQGNWPVSAPCGHSRVISAMAGRLYRVGEDVQGLHEELADIRADLSELRRKAVHSANPRRRR